MTLFYISVLLGGWQLEFIKRVKKAVLGYRSVSLIQGSGRSIQIKDLNREGMCVNELAVKSKADGEKLCCAVKKYLGDKMDFELCIKSVDLDTIGYRIDNWMDCSAEERETEQDALQREFQPQRGYLDVPLRSDAE